MLTDGSCTRTARRSHDPSGPLPTKAMPYIVTFRKPVAVSDRGQYINDCCVGGDIVLDRLLPALRTTYGAVQSNQEDWGWFAWFDYERIKLAVDVHTDDAARGEFQVHLTSRKPRLLLGSRIEDTPQLDALRELVLEQLRRWNVDDLEIERVDADYR